MKAAFMILEQRNPRKVARKGSEIQPLPFPERPGPHVRLTPTIPSLRRTCATPELAEHPWAASCVTALSSGLCVPLPGTHTTSLTFPLPGLSCLTVFQLPSLIPRLDSLYGSLGFHLVRVHCHCPWVSSIRL